MKTTKRAGGAALENYYTYRSYSIRRKKIEDGREDYVNIDE